jgi:hypothetical protein
MVELYFHSPHTSTWPGAQLIKLTKNVIFSPLLSSVLPISLLLSPHSHIFSLLTYFSLLPSISLVYYLTSHLFSSHVLSYLHLSLSLICSLLLSHSSVYLLFGPLLLCFLFILSCHLTQYPPEQFLQDTNNSVAPCSPSFPHGTACCPGTLPR